MSVYQLRYMDRIPDAAVCNEAVKLAQRKGFGSLKGFVNGVLRTIAREKDQIRPESRSVEYSLPQWIVDQWTEEYGEETALRMMQSQYEERPLSIRLQARSCRSPCPAHLRRLYSPEIRIFLRAFSLLSLRNNRLLLLQSLSRPADRSRLPSSVSSIRRLRRICGDLPPDTPP